MYFCLYWSWQVRHDALAAVRSPARAARAPSFEIDAQFVYPGGASSAILSSALASAGRSLFITGGFAFNFIHACSGQSGRGFVPHSAAPCEPDAAGLLASDLGSVAARPASAAAFAAAVGVSAGAESAGAAEGAESAGAAEGAVFAGAAEARGASGVVVVDSVVGAGAPDSDFVHAAPSARTRASAGAVSQRAPDQEDEEPVMRTGSLPKAPRIGLRCRPHMQRTVVELIAAKRDGGTLTEAEIARLLGDFGKGEVADYQMAAFLMAVFFRGLDDVETVALTQAMLHSGSVLDLSSVSGVKVDKHSTGGVGDKVSICLAPLVAACGVPVPMVSGRGLGHTGGTLDKLEAIPGFRTDLPVTDFARIVGEVGTCMIGQTKEIAPADKRIYALRDVTATVESIPLIVASILSKKLAEGIDGLVLDVKVGKGAFMKSEERARALADKLVRVGTLGGKKVVAVLTRMDAPLGRAVGNANETREALEVLHGRGPSDLVECTLVLGAEMLVLGGQAIDIPEATTKLREAIASGRAIRVMENMVAAQGGDASVVADPAKLTVAPEIVEVKAARSGFVTGIDALAIGLAGVAMGAGRTRADQKVDPAVGIEIDRKPGEAVASGDVVARLFVRDRGAGLALAERVVRAFEIGDAAPPAEPLVVGRITA